MSTTIQKWGNSLGVRIPKKIADQVGFEKGSEIEFIIVEGNIVLRPARYNMTFEELLEESK